MNKGHIEITTSSVQDMGELVKRASRVVRTQCSDVDTGEGHASGTAERKIE